MYNNITMARTGKAPRQYGAQPTSGGGSHRGIDYGRRSAAEFNNDVQSNVTDTSAITDPTGLGFSFSNSQDDDDNSRLNDTISYVDNSSHVSALTGLTGWTSGNGTRGNSAAAVHGDRTVRKEMSNASMILSDISELGNSEYHPQVTLKSYSRESQSRGDGTVSELDSRGPMTAYSFDMNGSIETSLENEFSSVGGYDKKMKNKNKNNKKNSQHYDEISAGSKTSSGSNNSKKRAPVPPLRDPTLDDTEDQQWEEDCNYDINPTLMFLVLESKDWKEAMALLDGKGLENKNEAWNLGHLFGDHAQREKEKEKLTKKRKEELRTQARTWIIRRERNGKLRWRMLPIHAALAFNAPFDVVVRLYHLYPGGIRCRNDQGMLPLHHVFKYGSEDKILELFLDVFPEALTVLDDKKRLPLACTPPDGSDNERRSNILKMFAAFQIELAKKEAPAISSGNEPEPEVGSDIPSVDQMDGCLGAAPPRYTNNTYYNNATYNSVRANSTKKSQPKPPSSNKQPSEADRDLSDKYASTNNKENGENIPLNGALLGLGLLTIPEDETFTIEEREAFKSELMELGEKKKRRGIRKLFKKKTTLASLASA